MFLGRTDVEAETPILWPPDVKSWHIWKDPDAGKDWGQEEKGTTGDEMVGWHHQLNGYGFGWTPGVGDGQGGLACCGSWGHKESDTMERLNWTETHPHLRDPISLRSPPRSPGTTKDGEGGERHTAGTLREECGEQRTCHLLQGGSSGLNQALARSVPRRGRERGGQAPRDFRSTKRRKSSGREGGRISSARLRQETLYLGARMGRMVCHIMESQGREITFLETMGICHEWQNRLHLLLLPGSVAFCTVSLPIWLQGNVHGHGKRELGDESLRSSQWDL